MSGRDPKVPVRRQASLRRDSRLTPRSRPRFPAISQVLVAILFIAMLAGTVGFIAAALSPEPDRSPGPSGQAGLPTPGGSDDPGGPTPIGSGPEPSSGDPGASPAGPGSSGPIPIVPVIGFWEGESSISTAQLRAVLEGRSDRYASAILPEADRAAIEAALDVRSADSVTTGTSDEVISAVATGTLGFLRAPDLTPMVHALAVDGRDLFGNARSGSLEDWPLLVDEAAQSPATWDQGSTWTIVAGGDVLMDRGVYDQVVVREKGIGYPFDGGQVEITGSTCCGNGPIGQFEVPVYEQRGDRGAIRSLLSGAGLSIANLENPTPDDWVHHPTGTTFTGDPALLTMLAGGGLDWVSLANDHMDDAGRGGIRDTVGHLPGAGLAGWGAGRDVDEARAWSQTDIDGHALALLPCVAVDGASAGRDRPGGRPCDDVYLVDDIRDAAAAGAVVVVFPHWGVEYQAEPLETQRSLAASWAGAGADLILGAHSHVVSGVEDFDGAPAFYSLGNLVYDEDWSEATMEGLLVEATFHGSDLVQVRMRPTLIHDQCQPNLLDPAGDGQVVLRRMRRLSEGLVEA